MNFFREALDAFNNRTQAMKDFNQFAQGSLLEFQTGRAHWGNDDPVALAQRFIGWSKVLSERNATAVASSNLRLYAARGNGQAPARKEWNAIPVSKSRLDYLSTVKNVAQNPRYAAASEIEELTDHPFLRLMNQFNEFHNGTEGLSLTSIYLDLIGNSYWHIERDNMGVPVALYPLMSQYCAPVPDPEQFVKGYLYGIDPNNRKPFDRDEIIHFKLPNPNDAIIGVGRLISFWRSHDLSESYAQYEKSITDNRARPDALVSYKTGKLDPKARAELEAEWNRKFKGSGNAGKILVTDFEYDVKELGFTPAMVAALDTRRWTRNELAAAFGVPIPMIDTEGVSLANYNTALTHYGRFTIAPVLRLIEHKLNTELVSKYDDRLFCCFDNPVPEDMQFKAQQEKDRLASGAMTINEVRISAGQSEVEWGNEPLVRAGTIPLSESIADSKKKSLNQTQKKNHALSHLVATKNSERPEDGEQVNNPKANDGEVDELTPTQKKLAKRVRQFLLEVIDEMLSLLDSESTDVSWISNNKWIQRAVSLTREFVGLELETGFDEEREATGVELTPWTDLPEAQQFIENQTFQFVKSMNKKTQADFKRELQKGIDAGESIPQLTKRMEKVFEGYPQQKRAELIARTESARAIMAGKEQAWIQSGVVTHKVWDSQNDSCPFCLAMEGKEMDLGSAWFSEGETMVVEFEGKLLEMPMNYGPVPHPPLHPNCRCSMTAKIEMETPRKPEPEEVKVDAVEIRNDLGNLKETFEDKRQSLKTQITSNVLLETDKKSDLEFLQLEREDYAKKPDAVQSVIDEYDRRINQMLAELLENKEERKRLVEELSKLIEAYKEGQHEVLHKAFEEFTGGGYTFPVVFGKHEKYEGVPAKSLKAINDGREFLKPLINKDTAWSFRIHGTLAPEFVGPTKKKYLKPGTRSGPHYVDELGVVSLSDGNAGTVVHEIAHWIERRGKLLDKTVDFLERRTQGETAQKLSELIGDDGYDDSEVAKPDDFKDPYMGKQYILGDEYPPKLRGQLFATEILSMGLEELFKNAADFAEEDSEYFDFVIECLKDLK